MIRDLEKDLIEIESAIKSNEERGNTFTVSVLQQAYKRLKDTQWIPCSERLPQDEIDVLVWFEYFRFGEYNRLFQTMGISYTYKGKWSGFVNGSSGWRELNIIAWMPLPQPYEQ